MYGPPVSLPPSTATTLAMVLYELATNAAKYGALSDGRGRVEIGWRLEDNGLALNVVLSWVERDGPAPAVSVREGFGTGFITRSVEYELHGTAALDLRTAGLRCTISFPLRRQSPAADLGTA